MSKRHWIKPHKRITATGKQVDVKGHYRSKPFLGWKPEPLGAHLPTRIGEHEEFYPEGAEKPDVPTMWFYDGDYDGRQAQIKVDLYLKTGHSVLVTKVKGINEYAVHASEAPVVDIRYPPDSPMRVPR